MTEADKITEMLGSYKDRERLEVLLKLVYDHHLTVDQAADLIQGDRNYLATELLREIREALKREAPTWTYPSYPSTPNTGDPIWVSPYKGGSTTTGYELRGTLDGTTTELIL